MISNTTIEEMLDANPLVQFSVYTQLQLETVRDIGKKTLDVLDTTMQSGIVEGTGVKQAYALFWLWVLGSYEITRTMCQADKKTSCFSERLRSQLYDFKQKITPLRIAFAKQEYIGRANHEVPIQADASIATFDLENKDFGFRVKDTMFSVRVSIEEFDAIFSTVERADFLKDHRKAYLPKP